MPDGNPAGGQDNTASPYNPLTDVYISPMAQFYMGLKAEAQPGSPPAVAGDPSGGQGGGDGGEQPKGGGGGFDWGLFPDIPEAHRPLLEPHLKNVQGHVTKLEQAHAPWKSFAESGADPQTVQNLVAFDQQFTQDPVGTWLTLAENMQKEGTLSGDLDLSAVKLILEGKDPDGAESNQEDPNGQPPEGEEIPQWAQAMKQENEELKQRLDGREESEAAQQRAQQLSSAMEGMKSQLKEAGYTDENLPDEEALTGAIIAHKGDVDKAVASLVALRENVLKGLTNGKPRSESEPEEEGPDMPNGAPKTPKRAGPGRGRAFAEANKGAAQMLERRMRDEAQG